MADIIFTIPDNQISRVVNALAWKFKIPKINTGTSLDPVWENEFTDAAWAKEATRRWIIKQVQLYEKMVQRTQLPSIEKDDDLVS